MRKYLALVLAIVLSFSLLLTACGETEGEPESTQGNTDADVTTVAEGEEEEEVPEGDEAVEVMTYEEYAAAELDTEVVIEAYVQAKQSWWEDKATIYTQDADGAYFVYDAACSQEDYDKLAEGTKIRVTGFKSEWAGEVEIIDATIEVLEDADTYVAEPVDATELLGTDELISYQNMKVSFTGLTVEDSGDGAAYLYAWDGSGVDGDDLYFKASYNGATYTFVIESYLCDNTTEVYSAVKNLKVGDVIDMEGFLYWYEGVQPHITSVTVK